MSVRAIGAVRQWGALVAVVATVSGSSRAAAARAQDRLPPADVLCAARAGACVPPPYVIVMSAFPAEIEPVLAKAQITETISTGTRTYHVGTLADVRVVLVRCGIGLVNAATTTRGLLDRFDVSAIVFSGVAGSGLNIGDVAVPLDWSDGTESFPVAAPLFAVAQTLTSPPVMLERCTPVPPDPPGPMVCLGQAPRIVAGGHGESSDPYGGKPFPCMAGGGPVSGCSPLLAGPELARAAPAAAQDMETAAVARVARDAGVPYLGFRGVSDGNGDPLGLPGFPTQFFAYYRLSADNAAATATAFLDAERQHDPSIAVQAPVSVSARSRIGAACDWERAGGTACAGASASRAVTADVSRACGLAGTAGAAANGSAKARTAARRARRRWHRAARRLASEHSGDISPACRQALVGTLEARAAPSP